jgi:pentapeptide MXKDX repeat protein
MKYMMSSVAVVVAAVMSVAMTAQTGGTMAKGDKMDKMAMKDVTYSGCIEAGSVAGTFTLTHLAAEDHMGKDAMKKGTMKKDTMAKDSMSKDAMAPETLTLSSPSVDLGKHLGHKVSVTGSAAHGKMDAMAKDTMAKDTMAKDGMTKSDSAFTVQSLKMVAASCS